jgi:hypothetical protein
MTTSAPGEKLTCIAVAECKSETYPNLLPALNSRAYNCSAVRNNSSGSFLADKIRDCCAHKPMNLRIGDRREHRDGPRRVSDTNDTKSIRGDIVSIHRGRTMAKLS